MTTNPKDLIGVTKPPLHLVPAAATLEESLVFELGKRKYGPYNWRLHPVRFTIYLDAALRHILSALDGEDIDPESGRSHIAHARACMAIILDAKATGNLVDDRPTPGAAARLIKELTKAAAPPPDAPHRPTPEELDELFHDLDDLNGRPLPVAGEGQAVAPDEQAPTAPAVPRYDPQISEGGRLRPARNVVHVRATDNHREDEPCPVAPAACPCPAPAFPHTEDGRRIVVGSRSELTNHGARVPSPRDTPPSLRPRSLGRDAYRDR